MANVYEHKGKYYSILQPAITKYCGGSVLTTKPKARCDLYWDTLYVDSDLPQLLPAKALQIAAPGDRIAAHLLQKRRGSKCLEVDGVGRMYYNLPTKYKGTHPSIPSREFGRELQGFLSQVNTFSVAGKNSSYHSSQLAQGCGVLSVVTKTSDSRKFTQTRTNLVDDNHVNWNTYRQIPYIRINAHTLHDGLPWFCPINKPLTLRARMKKLLAAGNGKPFLLFDHVDVFGTDPNMLWITIMQLYNRLGNDGVGYMIIDGVRVYYSVFMPFGTNSGHMKHLTMGALISPKRTIKRIK